MIKAAGGQFFKECAILNSRGSCTLLTLAWGFDWARAMLHQVQAWAHPQSLNCSCHDGGVRADGIVCVHRTTTGQMVWASWVQKRLSFGRRRRQIIGG